MRPIRRKSRGCSTCFDLKWGATKPRSFRSRGELRGERRGGSKGKRRCVSGHYLRPVDGIGLFPIQLNVAETKIIDNKEVFGATKMNVLKEHVEVTLDTDFRLRVKATSAPVYFTDRKGSLKRIKKDREAVLQTGSVLYFDFKSGIPKYGYVLSVTGKGEGREHAVNKEEDVIEILDDEKIIELSDSEEEFDDIVSSWETIEKLEDLNILPARQARHIAMTLGVDTSEFLEKSDIVTALAELKNIGRAEWLLRRKRAEEARMAEREKELQVMRRRKRLEGQKQKAVQKVKSLAKNANLKTFLNRIGIDVRPPFNIANLKKAYKKAMLKYHPDRTIMQSEYDRFLAEEITKWITHAWKELN